MKRLLCLALLLLAQPAWANYSASLRLSNSFVTSPSFDAFSEDNLLLQAEFNAARQLYPLWQGELWAEGSYLVGSSSSQLFGDEIELKVLVQSALLGVRYTYPLLYWLNPFVRLDLGVLVGSLTLEPSGRPSLRDRAVAFNGQLLAGVELLWPRRALRDGRDAFTAGLVIEGGYALTSSLAFRPRAEEDDELQQIPALASSLGGLALRGAQLRIGVIFRF